jgi:hypothetical protein
MVKRITGTIKLLCMTIEIDLTVRCEAPPRPERVSLANTRQITMTQFGITFALPPVGAPDVATRELTTTVNGVSSIVAMTGQPTISDEVVFNLNDDVTVTLVDIDGSGNHSPASAPFTFVVTDTVPPPTPGTLSQASVRQIDTP